MHNKSDTNDSEMPHKTCTGLSRASLTRHGNAIGTLISLAFVVLVSASGALAADAPLANAAEKQDRATVRALIAHRVNVNQPQLDGMTALHWAVHHDDLETAKLLVGAKADVKAANRYGVTPLSLACTNGNEAMVKLLLDAGADPNASLRGNETPLMTAARTGKLGPVRALLARGADVNAKERRGQTALMWAAAEGHVEVVQVLLGAGADFRSPLPSGFTPLFFAVREGRTEVARILLKAGADVNEAMKAQRSAGRAPARGTTPLVLAVENGHFELAAALLEAGADPNDQRSGFTALHTLSWVRKPNRGDEESGDPAPIGSGKLTSLQLVDKLVEHGADVNARLERGASGRGVLTRKGATPFLLAAMTADVPFMKKLVKLGADPRLPNAHHCYAPHGRGRRGMPCPQRGGRHRRRGDRGRQARAGARQRRQRCRRQWRDSDAWRGLQELSENRATSRRQGSEDRGLEPQEQVRLDAARNRRRPPARQLQAFAGDHGCASIG